MTKIRGFAALAAFLSVASSFNAKADTNAHSEHFGDHEVIHLTNSDPFPVTLRFNLDYDYKCGDEYSYWQHYSGQNQGASLNAYGKSDAVFYFPPCSSWTQAKNVSFQWISSTRSDMPQQGPAQAPVLTPQGDIQAQTPQPQPLPQPQPQPQAGQNQTYVPQPYYGTPASGCFGPLGAWANAHVVGADTYWATLQSRVLFFWTRHADGTTESYSLPVSLIDDDTVLTGPDMAAYFFSKNSALIVTHTDASGTNPTWGAGMTLPYASQADAVDASHEIDSLVSRCTGQTSLNDVLRPQAATGSEALALELDSSAAKSVSATPAGDGLFGHNHSATATRVD